MARKPIRYDSDFDEVTKPRGQAAVIVALRADLADAAAELEKVREHANNNGNAATRWSKVAKEHEESIKDLKERLANAEASNEFMRGYLARVQEDDTVREDLITVGDPEGESTLTPKRKGTAFLRPNDYREDRDRVSGIMGSSERWRDPPRRKHWVTY